MSTAKELNEMFAVNEVDNKTDLINQFKHISQTANQIGIELQDALALDIDPVDTKKAVDNWIKRWEDNSKITLNYIKKIAKKL